MVPKMIISAINETLICDTKRLECCWNYLMSLFFFCAKRDKRQNTFQYSLCFIFEISPCILSFLLYFPEFLFHNIVQGIIHIDDIYCDLQPPCFILLFVMVNMCFIIFPSLLYIHMILNHSS